MNYTSCRRRNAMAGCLVAIVFCVSGASRVHGTEPSQSKPAAKAQPGPSVLDGGDIRWLPYNRAPFGIGANPWTAAVQLCDGSVFPIAGNEALFRILGKRFGG